MTSIGGNQEGTLTLPTHVHDLMGVPCRIRRLTCNPPDRRCRWAPPGVGTHGHAGPVRHSLAQRPVTPCCAARVCSARRSTLPAGPNGRVGTSTSRSGTCGAPNLWRVRWSVRSHTVCRGTPGCSNHSDRSPPIAIARRDRHRARGGAGDRRQPVRRVEDLGGGDP
jgi:hypothetical protein